jgi:hypothetical protein
VHSYDPTAEEVTEHGRWRTKRSLMDMLPTAYNKWTIANRILIAMLCL